MPMENMLDWRDRSVLIIGEGNTKDIVIGVPHHAPLGVEELPCPDHRDADENVGLLGLYVAQLLNCSYVVACNYFLDSNKHEESDYFKRLLAWNPRMLLEIHGHGSGKAKYHIEISSGNAVRNKWSNRMASELREKMAQSTTLRDYTISGDYNAIYFQASGTKTITSDRWLPFHVELPKRLRMQRTHYEPFCELLAEAVTNLLREVEQTE
jgi:hypothetical protein